MARATYRIASIRSGKVFTSRRRSLQLQCCSVFTAKPVLQAAGVNGGVIGLAVPYAISLQWSLPLMIYAAFRRYLQGISLVRPVMIALITQTWST